MNGKTHGLKLSGPLTVQELVTCLTSAPSTDIVAADVVVSVDDFERVVLFIVTAIKTATDIANSKNRINTNISPPDTLVDFLQNLCQMTMRKRQRQGKIKPTVWPTMYPELFAPESTL